MADLQQILTNAASSNPELRKEAEKLLNQARVTSLGGYCKALTDELCNENAGEFNRQMAGLLLKNAISSSDQKADAVNRNKWLNEIADSDKMVIMGKLLRLIASDKEVSSTAGRTGCQVASKIARLEVPRNGWVEFFEFVSAAVDAESRPVGVRINGHLLLGYFTEDLQTLCDEWGKDLLNEDKKTFVLKHLSQGLRDPDWDVRLAALKGFYHAILFADRFMRVEGDRRQIFALIGETLTSAGTREDVEQAAWEVMLQIATHFYPYLQEILPGILNLSVDRIQRPEKQNMAMVAVEFWSTICDEEILIMEQSSSFALQKYIELYKDTLLPVLYEATTKQEEEEDEWTLHMAAGACVGLCAQVLKDAILPSALAFIDSNFSSPHWERREAAVFVYGSILEGPSQQGFAPLLHKSLPGVCRALKDTALAVRDSCAWAIGVACKFHMPVVAPMLASQGSSPGLVDLLLSQIDDVPRVVKNVCFALFEIFAEAPAVTGAGGFAIDAEVFTTFADALVRVVKRPDANECQLRETAYHALYMLISRAEGEATVQALIMMLKQFLSWMEETTRQQYQEDLGFSQAAMLGCINALVDKIRPELLPPAKTMLSVFLRVISHGTTTDPEANTVTKWSPAAEEVFLATSMLCVKLADGCAHLLPDLDAPLNAAIAARDIDHHVCGVAIELIGALATSAQAAFAAYAPKYIELLFAVLRDVNSHMDLKPKSITTLSDIALACPKEMHPFLPTFLSFLDLAAKTQLSQGHENENWLTYISELRDATLNAYSATIYCIKDCRAAGLDVKGPVFLETDALPVLEFINRLLTDHPSDSNIKNAVRLLQDEMSMLPKDILKRLHGSSTLSLLRDRMNTIEDVETKATVDQFCRMVEMSQETYYGPH